MKNLNLNGSAVKRIRGYVAIFNLVVVYITTDLFHLVDQKVWC